MKEERILKKVGKLLSMYGVNDEEKEKFLLDLKDKKYDDQEEVEETVEDEEEVESPNEEEKFGEKDEVEEKDKESEGVEEVGEEVEEVEPKEEPSEESTPEKSVEEEKVEKVVEEQPQEQELPPQEENVDVQDDARFQEMQNTIDTLLSRIESLEDIISKMGVEVEHGEDVGIAPSNPGAESQKENDFDKFNRMRMGR